MSLCCSSFALTLGKERCIACIFGKVIRVQPLNNGPVGTSHFIHYREVVGNVAVDAEVCPIFGVSIGEFYSIHSSDLCIIDHLC